VLFLDGLGVAQGGRDAVAGLSCSFAGHSFQVPELQRFRRKRTSLPDQPPRTSLPDTKKPPALAGGEEEAYQGLNGRPRSPRHAPRAAARLAAILLGLQSQTPPPARQHGTPYWPFRSFLCQVPSGNSLPPIGGQIVA